jgi:serine/threonine protein kinase
LKDTEKAAFLLEGKVLKGGWKVTKKYDKSEFITGGIYSCCYEVKNENGETGFLKAFDYSDATRSTDNPSALISNITNAYEYEKKILNICLQNGLNNVVRLIDSGGIDVDEAPKYPRVEYLILEHAANGDIRKILDTENISIEWKLRSLHQITKAISQLHKIHIAHQDIKPSNIISFAEKKTKLTDLGSACTKEIIQNNIPLHLENNYSGSYEYCPPELLYGKINSDWEDRRIVCDLYLLGNMIVFYFMGNSINFLIKNNLDRQLWWERPEMYNRFDYVKPYLIEAFEKSLEDFRRSIEFEDIKDELEMAIRFLCNPDPISRGHNINLNQKYNKYGLARFITMFDRLARKYEHKLI